MIPLITAQWRALMALRQRDAAWFARRQRPVRRDTFADQLNALADAEALAGVDAPWVHVERPMLG